MLQNPCKTFGFKKNMVYKIPPDGGGGASTISSQWPIVTGDKWQSKSLFQAILLSSFVDC